MMKTINYSDNLPEIWNKYVEVSNAATFYHHSGWKNAIEKTFGHKPFYISAEQDGEFRGILPLFLIKNMLFGRLLVSIPYGVYGGICAEDAEIEKALIDEAIRIAQEEKVKYVELRNVGENSLDLPEKDLYYTFISKLPEVPDKCIEMIPRKSRTAVRKGIKFGLEAEFGLHQLKECYSLYAPNKRDLGSPFHAFTFFENLVNEFKEQSTVLCVKHESKVVASVLTFFFKDTVIPYYSGSLPEYNQYRPNNFMYFKLMEYGVEKGYKYFDFGRSRKDTGSFDFKRHQGFEPQQLHYQYYLHTAKEIPNVSPSNPKSSLLQWSLKRLPVSLAKVLSAPIVRRMPY